MMYYIVRFLCLTVLLIYTVDSLDFHSSLPDHDKSKNPKGFAALSAVKSQWKTCFLGVEEIKTAECDVPHGINVVSYLDRTVSLPQHSICRTVPTHDYCIRCEHGLWQPSECPISAGSHRIKRSLRFLQEEISNCSLFCDNDEGGLDFSPPTFISCESPQSPLFASRRKTHTSVAWPMPVARDSQGTVLNVRRLSEDGTPGDVFSRGHHQIIYRATSDNGLSSHCFITFEVKVLSCQAPVIPNGKRMCDNNDYIYGTVCNVSCNEGYVIEGSSQLVCQSNKAWGHSLPTCTRKTCPSLSEFTCSDGYNYGSVCEVSCNYTAGQSPTSRSKTYCLSTGQWKQPLPSCVDSAPPVFKNCPVGSIVAYTDTDSTLTTVTYDDITAVDNYGNVTISKTEGPNSGSLLSVGITTVRYKADDANGNVADCVFNITVIAPRCSRPSYNDIHLTYTCDNDYFNTSTCTTGCIDGYTLSGSSSIECQSENTLQTSMTWTVPSGQAPSCQKPSCPALNIPKNGNLTCDRNALSEFCTMSCNSNWDIPRNVDAVSNLFVCGSSGRWLPHIRVPDCTVKRIPSEMRLKTSISYYASTCQLADGNQVVNNLMAVVNSSEFYSGTNCSHVGACSAKDASFACQSGNRRKRNTDEDSLRRYKRSDSALVVTWYFSVEYICGSMSVHNCVTYHENVLLHVWDKLNATLHNGGINSTAPEYQLRQTSLNHDYADFHCEEGMLPVFNTGSCAVCPTGTMYNSTTTSCVSCPRGSYQDKEYSFSCKPCPAGTKSVIEGAWTAEHCKVQCQAGWVSVNGIEPCFPCQIGMYQSLVGSTTCKKCPLGSTTKGSGSASSEQCNSFEYSVIGPSELQSSTGTSSLSDFTVFMWIKVRKTGVGSILSFGGTDLSVGIGQQVNVSVNGHSALSASLVLEKWTHIGVTFKQSTKQVTLYIAGTELSSNVIATSTVITTSSKMRLIVGNGDEISMRSVQLLNRFISAAEFGTTSSTCTLNGEHDTVLSMETLQKSSGVVSVVFPSSCNAVDDCMTSPCNGHQCIDTPSSYVCQCQNGYTGSHCTIAPDFCINHQCQNEATCTPGVSNYTCECAVSYKGTLCENLKVNGGYSEWTSWSVCSVSCGGGNITRTRTCDNPSPDKDAISCSGQDVESKPCNTEACPVCSATHLQQCHASGVPVCNGTESELHCRPSCDVGSFNSKKQVSLYTCRDGVWSPSVRLPPCFRIVAPESLAMTAQVKYTNQDCSTALQQAEALRLSISKKLETVQCLSHSECNSRVVVSECSNTGPVTSTFSYFTIPLPDIDLDIENYVRNKIRLAKVIDAIRTLEITGGQLQDTGTRVLEVSVGGTTYIPTYPVNITTSIVCPRGTFPEDVFCGECPPGTHYFDATKSCVLCERGTFQTQPRSYSCDTCPDGKTTLYKGSTHAANCSEENDHARRTSTESSKTITTTHGITDIALRDPAQPNNNLGVIVGSIVGSIILVVLIVFVFCFMKRKKSLHENENESHHYETGFHFTNGSDYLTAYGVKEPENVYSEISDPDVPVVPKNPYYHHVGNGQYIPCDPREDEQGPNPHSSADTIENTATVDSIQFVKEGATISPDLPTENTDRTSYVPMVNNVDLVKPTEGQYENSGRRDSPIDPYYQY